LKRIILIITAFLVFQSPDIAQTKTNLDLVFDLINHSILKAENFLNQKNSTYNFVYTSPDSYSFLKSSVVNSYIDKGILLNENDSLDTKLEHTIKNIRIEYSNPYKDGFFGDLLIERTIKIDANLIISDKSGIKTYDLNDSYKDTVEVASISSIENPAIPFTQSAIPELPIFSNLLEPIIVVGTLIVTIILFFTVRSK